MTYHPFSEGCPEGPSRTGPTRWTIAIVDDHLLLSDAIRAALVADGFSVVVPRLTALDSMAAELHNARPAVALLDLDLGPLGAGEDLLPMLVELGTRVLVVTGNVEEAVIGRCLERGAWGWVPKASPVETLLEAIGDAAAGRAVMEPAERDRLRRVWRQRRQEADRLRAPFDALSRREAEVLAMLREGKPVERIAAESFVSEATVRAQVRAIRTKLGVNSQLEAVAMATRAGWSADRKPR